MGSADRITPVLPADVKSMPSRNRTWYPNAVNIENKTNWVIWMRRGEALAERSNADNFSQWTITPKTIADKVSRNALKANRSILPSANFMIGKLTPHMSTTNSRLISANHPWPVDCFMQFLRVEVLLGVEFEPLMLAELNPQTNKSCGQIKRPQGPDIFFALRYLTPSFFVWHLFSLPQRIVKVDFKTQNQTSHPALSIRFLVRELTQSHKPAFETNSQLKFVDYWQKSLMIMWLKIAIDFDLI